MKYRKYISEYDGKKFIIEEDNPEVGFYLYVYENDNCIKDYLQDNLKIAKECAFDDYSVPLDSWKEIND